MLASAVCAQGITGTASPVAAQAEHLDLLNARIDSLRQEWGIPGLALAIVRGDSVLLARGYGVRGVEGGEPVDNATLFAIGSTTKAFTAAAMAMLVSDSVVGWDDRVTEHLPGFVLSDSWITQEITIRDLLAHRSGLPMANTMWLTGELDGDQLIRRLRHLEPAAAFRTELTYQNVLYLAAGRIIAARTGSGWEAFIAERILTPLGMDRTRTGVARLTAESNVATPHVVLSGEVQAVPYRDIHAIGPAGSLVSSAGDMAKWLRFQLAGGEIAGRRLVGEDALLETRRPQVIMRPDGPLRVLYPDARRLAYAMGWVVAEYRGMILLDHTGGIDGMTSLVALVPELDLGVAILTNLQSRLPPYWALYSVLDHILGAQPVDRSGDLRAMADQFDAAIAAAPERTPDAPPSHALAAYAGEYVSRPIGTARVTVRSDNLVLEMGRLSATLQPWHFDTFRAHWIDRAWLSAVGPGWVVFQLDRDGRVRGLELTAVSGETWTFERTSE